MTTLLFWFSLSVAQADTPSLCGEWVRTPVPKANVPVRDVQLHGGKGRSMYALWYAPSDGVTYAGAWDGARWRVEVLGQGRGDMVVVDDIPYVATTACDAASCVVSYGWREDGVWVLREVHNTIGPISAPSVSVDDNGHPHIVYSATVGDASMVMHATTPHGAWHVSTAYKGATHLVSPKVVVGRDDQLHLVVSETDEGGRILYGTRSQDTWVVSATELDRGREAQLVWGAIGAPYIGYFLNGQRVAVRTTDGQWVNYGAPHQGTGSLRVDTEGAPHFLLTVDARPIKRLEWMRWSGTAWHTALVAADPDGFSAAALSLDDSGCPSVLYQHAGASKTVFARSGL